LRSADFNNGTASSFAVDEGTWSVAQGKLSGAAAAATKQAANVFYLDDYLPVYFEVAASVAAEKPTAGWNANAYVIFDYYSPTDFKYAGINVSTNKIEMGIRDASGWHIVKQSTANTQFKAGTLYDVLLAVNGNTVTLSVAGVSAFTYTYAGRIVDGEPIFLNHGLVGLGTNGSKTSFDNFAVQILPPQLTLDSTTKFDSNAGPYLHPAGSAGTWTVSGGRYQGIAGSGQTGLSIADLGTSLHADSYLELEAKVRTNSIGGIVFDYYDTDQFKFVVLDVVNDKILIGHVDPRGGWKVDQSFAKVLDAGVDYTVKLTMRGASVSIQLNGATIGSYGFNSAVVDGSVGLLTRGTTSSFDDFRIRTNDRAFAAAGPLMTAFAPESAVAVPTLAISQVEPLLAVALNDWIESGLASSDQLATASAVKIEIVDLPGTLLAEVEGGTLYLDVDGGGYGWFVDLTPDNDNEFVRDKDGNLVTADGGPAAGKMDLLSVVMHELGHVMGFEHESGAEGYVMSPMLDAGERLSFDGPQQQQSAQSKPAVPAAEPRPSRDAGERLSFDGAQQQSAQSKPAMPAEPARVETQVFIEHLGVFAPVPVAKIVERQASPTAVNPHAPDFVTINSNDLVADNDEGVIDWSARGTKLKYGRR